MNTMKFIKPFQEISKEDVALAGGKGASLGEMTQAGIPVPPGFVILSTAFEQFLEEADLKTDIDAALHAVNHEEMHTVENAAEEIQALILNAKMPEDIAAEIKQAFGKLNAAYVAVRSSATAEDSSAAAWAGQLESYLNVTEKELLEKVQHCWASLFTPRAIFYRFEKNLHTQKISVAVVVQKMIDAEVSGIAFSVHPVTQDRNQLIIEAGFGLGEAIVGGQITPDSYVVEKKGWLLLDKHVHTQEKAIVKGKTGNNEWIALPEEKGKKQKLSDREILELAKLTVKIEQHYGFPVDIEFAKEKDKLYILQSRPITTLQQESEVKKKDELPINPADYGFLFKVENCPYFLASYWLHPEYKKRDFILANKGKIWKFYISKEERKRLGQLGLKMLEKGMPQYRSNVWKLLKRAKRLFQKIEQSDLSAYSNEALVKEFKEFLFFVQQLWELFFYTEYFMHDKVQQKIEQLGINTPAYLASSPKEIIVSQEYYARCKLAKHPSKEALKKHAAKYSYILYNEGGPTLTVERLKKELQKIKDPGTEIKKIENKHKEIISQRKHHPLTDAVRELAELKFIIRTFINKTIYGEHLIGKYLTEIGKRTDVKDFKEYHYQEVISLLLDRRVEKKDRKNFVLGKFNNWEDILGKEALKIIDALESIHDRNTTVLKGTIGNKGYYKGKVKIVPFDIEGDTMQKEIAKMEKGDVLVTGSTGPEMIRACRKAGAIVTDEGGICSHAAIVSRELGIPSVLATEIATDVLKDGDVVEVDADHGTVRILGKKEKLSSYTFLWGDYQTAWEVQTNLEAFRKYRDNIWNQVEKVIQVLRNNMCSTFHSTQDLRNDMERGKSYFNSDYVKKFIASMEKNYEEQLAFFKKLRFLDMTKQTNAELFSLFQQLADRWSKTISYFRATQAEGTKILVEELHRHLSPEDGSLLMTPSVLDIAMQEQQDWLQFIQKPYSEKRLLDHVAKYPWVVMKHLTMKDVLETMQARYEFDKKHLKPKYFKKEKEELRKKQSILLEEHPEVQQIVKILQRLGLSRMEVKTCWAGSDFYAIPLLTEIAKRTGETPEDIGNYYLLEEIGKLLEGKKLPEEEKNGRKRCFVGLWKNGKISFLSGQQAEKVAKEELRELTESPKTEELKGVAANPGKVRGIARILEANNVIQTREVRKSFKKGEILVTQMTQPNVIDIASKAAALVTDEGGMLSHAAIISRELKIPCIVGTHFATQVIKDGDYVEVDANNGMIKILQKADKKKDYAKNQNPQG